ncbi:MAG TPA: MlaD family protein [Vicinamibacterales bacterium]|nr:MlaD family protein [Vicinamibacterales bacterium]
MPRTRSLAWTELKIGILTVAALTVAAIVIFMLSGEGGFFWQRYELKTTFSNVAGLKAGAPVRVAGVEVGSVTDVQFSGAEVIVTFEVSRDMQPRITSASRASIGSVSLLGESALDITPSLEGTPVPEGGFVESVRAPGQLADVAEGATRSLEQATALLKDIRAGKGTVGKLFTDDQLYTEIQSFVSAADAVARALRDGRGTAGRLMTDDAVYEQLEAALRNLQAMTARLNAGEGSLGRLLNDPAFGTSLTSATANLDAITGRISKGEGTAGRLITDKELYDRMNSLTGRLDSLIARLNEGEGTAGRLLRDQQLYDNLNTAATELRGLVADIRKDPQKYLRIRVSIF